MAHISGRRARFGLATCGFALVFTTQHVVVAYAYSAVCTQYIDGNTAELVRLAIDG